MMRGRILIAAGLILFLVTVLGSATADEVDTWEGFDQYYIERFGEERYSLVYDTISHRRQETSGRNGTARGLRTPPPPR